MKRLLLFAMAIIFAMQLSAQTMFHVVGDTTTSTTSPYVPMYTLYQNSFTESLYPSSELMPGLITSISYYVSSTSYSNGTMKIYMKEVEQSSLSGFVLGSDFTEVYSGPATMSVGRNTFELTTPFAYTGGGNLLVAVIRDGTAWGSSPNYRQATVGNAVYDYDDDEEYFITTVPSTTASRTGVPVTMFGMESLGDDFCYPPMNLSCSGLEQTGATVSWETMSETNTTFGLAYRMVGEEEWTTENENINDLSYTLSGLAAYTQYEVKVWTVCDEENSSEALISFWTLPSAEQMIEIPYEQNFDALEDLSSWDLWTVTQSGTNQWYLGALGAHVEEGEEGQGLYVSNDNGVTNTYSYEYQTPSIASVAHLSTIINLEDDTYYGVEFDYKAVGELGYDEVVVSLFPIGTTLPTTNSIPTANIMGKSNSNTNEWTRVTVPIANDMPRGAYQLVISWRNDGSGGDNPPASIDNLYIFSTPCARVNEFTTTMEDAGGSVTMNVEVTDEFNEDAEYIVSYRYSGDTTWYTAEGTSPIAVTDLPYSSRVEYKVTANCGGGDLAVTSNTYVDWTLCNSISEFPYVENFDENSFIAIQDSARANRTSLNCWYNVNGAYSSYYWSGISSDVGIDSTKALYFYGTAYTTSYDFSDWMITPIFEMTGNERLNFQYKTSSTTNAPVIDVMVLDASETDYTSMADTANFTLLTSINTAGQTTGEWNMAEIFLNEYTGNIRLALAVRQKSSTFYIDDFSISEIPDCPEVYGLTVDGADHSVYVSYNTANIGEAGVTVAYAEVIEGEEFDPESAQTVSIAADAELPFQITDLTEGTTYIFAAQQSCGGAWSEPVTATVPMVYALPASFDFDTPETTPVLTYTSTNANSWVIGTAANNTVDDSGSPTAGGAMYVSNDNGATVNYTTSPASTAYASIPINIEPTGEIHISFDWKCDGEYSSATTTSPYDYMQVALVPLGQDFATVSPLTAKLFAHPNWQSFNTIIPAGGMEGIYNLMFKWYNDSGDTDGIPGVVDNIVITAFSCTSTSLETSVSFTETEESETGGALLVELTDEVNTDVTYVLRYKENASTEWLEITDITIDDFPYTVMDANFQTLYNIQIGVVCADGDEPAFANQVNITTPCQALPTPWTENFDVNPYNSPSCWERYSGLLPASGTIQTSDLTTSTSTYCWGWASNFACGETTSNMLRSELYSTSGYRYWAISPSINLADDGVAKQIAFDLGLRKYGSNTVPGSASDDRVMILVSLDNGVSWNIANGLVFADGDEDTEHNYSDLGLQMQRYVYKLVDENEEPIVGTVRFAFYSESTVSNADNYACIDNIAVEDYVSCPAPYNIEVSDATITSTTATATFGYYGDATTWEYVVVEGEDADPTSGTSVEVTTTDPIELTGLTPETTYIFAVRAICEDGESGWVTATFTTISAAETVPYETTFDEGLWSETSAANTANVWVVGEATGNEAPAAYISNDGESYAATLSSSQTISHLWKDFDFGETEDEFELTFDWKVTGRQEGNSVYGGIAAYLVDVAPLATGLLNSANMIAVVTGSDEWQTERVYLGNVTGEKRLVFTALGYTVDAELAIPAAIDNVSLSISSCPQVQGVTAENITTSTMDVAWTETGADSYTITYQAEGSEEELTATATSSPFTLEELTSATRYIITVTAVCGSEQAVASNAIAATTLQEPVELPYTCDFEAEGANGWLLRNSTCTNQWYVGTRTGGTSRELFISSDGGTSATYSASAGVVVAEKLFQLGATDSIRISFDVTVNGESSYDYLKVFFVDPTVAIDPTTNYSVAYASDTYSTGTIGGAKINQQSGTVHKVITIENAAPNGTQKLVFLWRNDTGVQNNPPAIIDNVSVEGAGEEITCTKPTAVVASAITSTSATISWTDNDESHSAWNVYYKAAGEEEYTMVSASETSIELIDLSAATTYSVYVTTDCGDEESAPTATITFATLCDVITAYPYVQDFESGANCWSVEAIQGASVFYENAWSVIDEYELIGVITFISENAMYHTYETGVSGRLVTPMFDLTSLTNPYVKFDYARLSDGVVEGLTVHYKASAEDSWTLLATMNGTPDEWILDSIALPNPSETYQLSFVSEGVYGYGVVLDNVTVYDAEEGEEPEPEPCDAPTALAASNITQTTAEISWNGTATSYEFKLNGGTAEALTATTKSLTGLTANTQYTVEVRAVCGDQTSDWVTTTFTTLAEQGGEVIAPVVTTLAATAITHESAVLNGTITAGSETITAQGFMYKATAAADWTTVNATGTTISVTLSALTAETEYTFKAFATTATGTVEGTAMTFTTTAAPVVVTPPTVATLAATAITHESAVLNGTITAGSETITAQGFKYKATAAADWTTVNATGTTISATLSALTAETEYTFKAFATTATGTVEGTAMTFTTTVAPIVAPVVTTLAATAVDHESAVLNGTITAGSETITAQGFMYKATAAADWTTVNATGETISATLTALTAETEYTFKAFATTATGTVEGTAMTFTTSATPIVAPTVVTLAATEITNATAKLNGTVTAGSEEILAQGFMYKASNAADWTTVAAVGETMSLTVEGLEAELEYVFKAFATTASGTTEGEELTFTTLAGLNDATAVSIIANVYPNPAEDKATISVSGLMNATKIVVSDMQGRILLSDDMNESTYELNTSNYASGVYYIRIISGNAVNTQKLIVK